MYEAAAAAGLYGPQADLAVTQALHETGWGRSLSGRNNYHGIKDFSGQGTKRTTWEVENGRRVTRKEPFANFDSKVGSFSGWKGLMERVYPDVMRAKTFDEAVLGLNIGVRGKPSYATDPEYNQRMHGVFGLASDYRPEISPKGLLDFARQTELTADIEGLFGPGQQAPSILDGFNIVATNNMTGLPTPQAKPAQTIGIPQAKPASLRVDMEMPGQFMARDVAQLNADIGNPEVYRQEVQRASLPDLPASPRGIGANPSTAYEPGRSIFDGIADMNRANEVVRDTGRTAIGSGEFAPDGVSMVDFAGVPSVDPGVTAVARGFTGQTAPAQAMASAQIAGPRSAPGPSGNPRDAFGSSQISAPDEVDMTAPSQSIFDPASFDMIDMPTTTAGLLGAIGAPPSMTAPKQAPQAAPPAQMPTMPTMQAPREIAARPDPVGYGQANVRTTPGAVPAVAEAVQRYGLNPDPGQGWSYGFSPYGSGVSRVHDNAPERVKAAGTGPGLFGAFKDDFGIDLTPSAGLMTAPIAMGLDAAGGGGLFSLANALGGSKMGLDRLDVVDRQTREAIDGKQDSRGGFLGMFSNPVGTLRNEVSQVSGGLFGGGGGQASGGFLGGIGDFFGGIFGGTPADYDISNSVAASRGSTGAASARGF
jgi:hypothetical protein